MVRLILFIGLGGAGQRHLRLFRKNLKKVKLIAYRSTNKTPLLNPDFSVNDRSSIEDIYQVKIYHNINDALDLEPDLVVISTPSSLHIKYVQLCVSRGINVFVEKPVSNSLKGLHELKSLAEEKNVSIQVGFQRRFHPHLIKINNIIKSGELGKVLNVNFTVASYIPRWHPYENFLDLYACRKDLGGGVLLTEIHEIDLAVWYFGTPKYVACIGGTYSNVGMDVEDTVHLTLDYVQFSVQINLTFWQKHHERFLSISGEDGYLSWNQDGDVLSAEYYNNPDLNGKYLNDESDNDSMFDFQIKSIIADLSSLQFKGNIDESIISMRIVEAAKESMLNRVTVEL